MCVLNHFASNFIPLGGRLPNQLRTQFINRMVPGACIPEHLIARLEAAADPAAEGIAIAAEQVRTYLGVAQGVHLMAVRAEERLPLVLDQAGISRLASV